MDNHSIIESIKKWQGDDKLPKLVCENNKEHNPLEPVVESGRVILKCKDCDFVLLNIPKAVKEFTGSLQMPRVGEWR